MKLLSRRLVICACVAFVAAASGFATHAYDREPPRIAHYSSEYARVGFVLDRSGELAKLRFDGSEEIFTLTVAAHSSMPVATTFLSLAYGTCYPM